MMQPGRTGARKLPRNPYRTARLSTVGSNTATAPETVVAATARLAMTTIRKA
jgi:hypothetical protein